MTRLAVAASPGGNTTAETAFFFEMKKINFIKLIFAVLLAMYGIVCAKDLPEGGMLDRVNLIAHEAGHLLCSWFGEFIQVIGGTLGQLFVPSAFVVYFYFRREFFSSAVSLFWVGQNFFGISVYIKDAQAMALPLVSVGGGEDVIHDWNYILSKFGLLRWDHTAGTIALSIGAVVMIVAVIWAVYCSFLSQEEPA